jgi:hypothetical protein
MRLRHKSRDAAYHILRNSHDRHARNIAADQPGSKVKLYAPELLATYKAECKRKRDFIKQAAKTERRLGHLVEALRLIMSDKRFQALLASEGLATMPRLLALRLQAQSSQTEPVEPDSGCPSGRKEGPVGGICPDVVDLFQDCPVKAKIFGLLRYARPARQLEIARLMIAMERVTFTYAKLLIALTPKAMLNDGFNTTKIANLTEDQYCMMEPEISALSAKFLSTLKRSGFATLELVAASAYFNRLMDNSRIVRYLAHNFPGRFQEFHELSVPMAPSGELLLGVNKI